MEEFNVKSEIKDCSIYEILSSPVLSSSIEVVSGKNSLKKNIVKEPVIHRPGLAITGYTTHFDYDRIQIFGLNEISYLESIPEETRKKNLKKYFEFDIPAIIITNDMEPPHDFFEMIKKNDVPLIKVKERTSVFIKKITEILEEKLAPKITVHGVLMEIFGMGVLIRGKSGIGKSECALDLLERGHRLIADDVVDIRRMPGDTLIGIGAHLIKHHMEIRGIGIINIKNIYGVRGIREKQKVDMLVSMEIWDEGKQYDRLGLEDCFQNIMNVNIPAVTVPVRPGRNIAVIIEVAAMNQRLKMMGYHAAKEFNKKLMDWIKTQEMNNDSKPFI